ncbi:MAG TPA: hypothetical protein V6C85_11545 [Allocoleopsis sp.]
MASTLIQQAYRIVGRIIDRKTHRGLPGLRVEAWDKDSIYDDLVGSAVTDAQGAFQMVFDRSYFQECFLDRQPDLFFRIFDGKELIKSTEDSVLWNIPMGETIVEIEVNVRVKNKCAIEGQLKSSEPINFSEIKLAVHAFIEGVEVARTEVDERGYYKLMFDAPKPPLATELRILPAKFSDSISRSLTLSQTVSAGRYSVKDNAYYASYDVLIPRNYIDILKAITKIYHMHGAVYTVSLIKFGGLNLPIFTPLPAVKIEFYEVDKPWRLVTSTSFPYDLHFVEGEETEQYLGCAYSHPDGSYHFDFEFSYLPILLFSDQKPDIRARLFQLLDGLWKQIYEVPVEWNIAEDYKRDYLIPKENVIPVPDASLKPSQGFKFTSVGLLPIDSQHIEKGYATAIDKYPERIGNIRHQPFCGTLRIFGLFADSLSVASYEVQISEADENKSKNNWQNITDPLHNYKWNSVKKQWEHQVLGPDPTTNRYRNIDTDPEADWHEHALKVTWNTANVPDGYYALRIIGYDAAGHKVSQEDEESKEKEMERLLIRVYNKLPEVSILALSSPTGSVSKCGAVKLGTGDNRKITFQITAYDSAGHLLEYWIDGTRGQPPQPGQSPNPAGSTVLKARSAAEDLFYGIKDGTMDFPVTPLPKELAGCSSALAYNFELYVQGSATDGYDTQLMSRRVKLDTNLVVSEP